MFICIRKWFLTFVGKYIFQIEWEFKLLIMFQLLSLMLNDLPLPKLIFYQTFRTLQFRRDLHMPTELSVRCGQKTLCPHVSSKVNQTFYIFEWTEVKSLFLENLRWNSDNIIGHRCLFFWTHFTFKKIFRSSIGSWGRSVQARPRLSDGQDDLKEVRDVPEIGRGWGERERESYQNECKRNKNKTKKTANS